MFRGIRLLAPLFTASAIITMPAESIIFNDSKKRAFYEDEENVVPIPGTVTPAPASELESLGANRIIDGISVRSTQTTESLFKNVREYTESAFDSLSHWVNANYTRFNETERQVTNTVSGLHNKTEDLLPNSLYILVAILTGTIAARTRGVVAKVALPTVFGLASFKYFLPKTFDNTTGFVWKLEKENVPQLAAQQESAYSSAVGLAHKIEETTESGKKSIENSANSLRKSIADITGLNIDEEVSKK
ncbi:MICOS subunit MIC26 [Candida viswanathii]|uniref:MICOS complex subunit n=1 Tax=Candida viswanathii TaxID=5486 RepID=A0A367XQU0_9ASCO|nr:MICOS subunit MIC26 [Candida viswanathii]